MNMEMGQGEGGSRGRGPPMAMVCWARDQDQRAQARVECRGAAVANPSSVPPVCPMRLPVQDPGCCLRIWTWAVWAMGVAWVRSWSCPVLLVL